MNVVIFKITTVSMKNVLRYTILGNRTFVGIYKFIIIYL